MLFSEYMGVKEENNNYHYYDLFIFLFDLASLDLLNIAQLEAVT